MPFGPVVLGAGAAWLLAWPGAIAAKERVVHVRPSGSAAHGQSNPAGGQAAVQDVYYPNCDTARAAGAAPIYRGQPGYRPELDRDNDGIACEPYRGRR